MFTDVCELIDGGVACVCGEGAALCLFWCGRYRGPSVLLGSSLSARLCRSEGGVRTTRRRPVPNAKSVWAHAHDALNTHTHTHCVSVRLPKTWCLEV